MNQVRAAPEGGERVLVAMSGGVDSSVAAALLVEAGHEVVGVTMKTFCYDATPGPSRTCCGLDGILDARQVADRLGIEHYVFDVEEDFTRDVIDDFVAEYARGRTPNPCVRCNSNTKFRDLLRRGEALGCDAIATGHYVRVEHPERASGPGGGPSRLLRGADAGKDQAYFLWELPHEILPRLRFPLGALDKPRVRELARERGLVTAEKPESQEICFVPDGDYRSFLGKRLAPRHPALEPGTIVTLEGEALGEHRGYAGFTVGQRRGLGGGFDEPLYVVEVRPETREVVVGPREALEQDTAVVEGLHWIAPDHPPRAGGEVGVQIRHRAGSVAATLEAVEEDRIGIRFHQGQRAVSPGQSAVFFHQDRVLGGGRLAGR
jgi:tRNA-specific 2-thiouridylase